jgi:hypothetical protein
MISIYNALSNMNLKEQLAKLPAILGFKTAVAGAETTAAVGATTAASALTFGIAAIAIAAGIATVVSAMSSAKQEAGDLISPADGKTQVSTREGGLFELSKNDDLVAGPGLAKNKGGGGKGQASNNNNDGGGNNQAMIAAINGVKASVDKLYDKKSAINLDGRSLVGSLLMGAVGLV